jgi:hypothetical protein
MPLSLEVALLYRSFPSAAELWTLVVSTQQEYEGAKVVNGFNGKKLAFGAVASSLLRTGANSFMIQLSGGSIEHGSIADLELDRLDIVRLVRDVEHAEQWLAKLLDDERLVQARLYDPEYDRWQNAEDLLIYEAEGRDATGLPRKSNGFPHPLTREIVDISGNPGRWTLRHGWIESIGATMWFGPAFWKSSGANRVALQSCEEVVMTDLGSGVTKVTTKYDVFRSAEGAEQDLQRRMRMALYGT